MLQLWLELIITHKAKIDKWDKKRIQSEIALVLSEDGNLTGMEVMTTVINLPKTIHARLSKASVSRVIIERTLKLVTVTITTARPGIIIGKGGQEVDKLKEELKKITEKEVQINIFEIKRPELDANLVAASVARQIESRISYRRAIKMAIAAAMRMNAEGIKIQISGRLNGAEMARSESYKDGRIPLSTFRADIDYALVEAHTTYGRLGVKVWIMKGEVYGKRELSPLVGMTKKQGGKSNSGGPGGAKKARRRK